MKKYLIVLAITLSSCQVGPFFYELESPSRPARELERVKVGEEEIQASTEACLLSRDLTDEEMMEGADALPGNGYKDSKWVSENPTEVVAQQVFQCEDGSIIILEDNGDIIFLENPSKET